MVGIGRAALNDSYTWHYSTQGLPALTVTSKNRELLPHIFTLTPTLLQGRLFSVALSRPDSIVGSRLFTGGLPFAVRTFLPDFIGAMVRAYGRAKVAQKKGDGRIQKSKGKIQKESSLVFEFYLLIFESAPSILKENFRCPVPKTGIILIDEIFYFSFGFKDIMNLFS